jgi:hypothetical protein
VRFERIIPVGRGALNTVPNLELRCGNCQRLKGSAEAERSGQLPSALPAPSEIGGLLEAGRDR